MLDPTREEMLEFLNANGFADDIDPEGMEFDREEAIYWFAENYHGGQWSNLYGALSASPYRPGLLTGGPDSESSAAAYAALEAEFGGANA